MKKIYTRNNGTPELFEYSVDLPGNGFAGPDYEWCEKHCRGGWGWEFLSDGRARVMFTEEIDAYDFIFIK